MSKQPIDYTLVSAYGAMLIQMSDVQRKAMFVGYICAYLLLTMDRPHVRAALVACELLEKESR